MLGTPSKTGLTREAFPPPLSPSGIARDFHVTRYRLYKQQVTIHFTYELGIRVAGIDSARTHEFATAGPDVYTKTAWWKGDWSIGYKGPSDEPRVVQIRTQGD
ncbi:hypothetical protein BFJ70_g16796 [Fusarium oxysporum]|nr:hypothetical protein BFJ70_g16796 [Fusarium oxysporum]